MSWLALGALAKRLLSAAWGWLSHASLWQLVSLGLALVLVVQHFELVHERKVAATYLKQRDYYKGEIDSADKAVREAQKVIDQVSRELRNRTDEENRRIHGDADALRVSGPGKALCRPASPAPGGSKPQGGKPDAAGPQMPPADSAAVPWNWLVGRAEQADGNRAEVLAWREWYRKLVENWPKRS